MIATIHFHDEARRGCDEVSVSGRLRAASDVERAPQIASPIGYFHGVCTERFSAAQQQLLATYERLDERAF